MIKLKDILTEVLAEADVFASGPSKDPNQLSLFPDGTPDIALAEDLVAERDKILAALENLDKAIFEKGKGAYSLLKGIGCLLYTSPSPRD